MVGENSTSTTREKKRNVCTNLWTSVAEQTCESDQRERERVVHCLLVQSISQAICNDNECRGIGPKIIGQIGQSNTILLDAASLCPSSVKDCLLCSRSPIKAQQE